MTDNKTPVQQIEELESFDPIIYSKGKRNLIFAKQGDRLFRIVYSTTHPRFFVLTPTSIEKMTLEEVSSILENYKGNDTQVEEKMAFFFSLYRTFTRDIVTYDPQQAPFLYDKSCQIITQSPAFKTVNKVYKVQPETPKTKKVKTGTSQPKDNSQPIQQKPEVPKEVTPVVSQVSKPNQMVVQKSSVVTVSKPSVSPAPTVPTMPAVVAQPPVISASETKHVETVEETRARLQADRERWARTGVVDLISGTKKQKVKREKRDIPELRPFATIGTPKPQSSDVTTPSLEPQRQKPVVHTRNVTSKLNTQTKRLTQPQQQPIEVQRVESVSSQSEKKHVTPEVPVQQVETTIVHEAKQNPVEQIIVETPIVSEPIEQVEVVETPTIVEEAPAEPVVAEASIVSEPVEQVEAIETPTVAEEEIVSVMPEPKDGFYLLGDSAIVLNETTFNLPVHFQPLAMDVLDFYGMREAAPNFQSFYTINVLKKAIELKQRNLKNPTCYDFEFTPQLFDNKTIIFKQGDEIISLSLNRKQPASFIRNVKTNKNQKLTWEEIEEILDKLSVHIPAFKAESVRAAFKKVHNSKTFLSFTNYPTVQQAITEHELRSYFERTSTQDVPPTLCSGQVIMARRNGKYYKVVLGEVSVFEVYHNGKVSPMTVDEFNTFRQELFARYSHRELKEFGVLIIKKRYANRAKQLVDSQIVDVVKANPAIDLSAQIEGLLPTSAPKLTKPRKEKTETATKPQMELQQIGQKSIEQLLEDARFFYAPDEARPDFKFEETLQQLRLAYAARNPGAQVQSLTPFIDSNNCLYYQADEITYIISLDAENPLFLKKRGTFTWPMHVSEIRTIFSALIGDRKQADFYIQYFVDLFNEHKKRNTRRPRKELPSVPQILESTYYKSLLVDSPTLLNIDPVICAGNIVIAKFGDVFYKITLDTLTYGAYENGEIRSMTEAEIRSVNRFLLHYYNPVYLQKKNANNLWQRAQKGMDPQEYFLSFQETEKSELETFIETFETVIIQKKPLPMQQVMQEQVTDTIENQIYTAFSFWPEIETRGDWAFQQQIEQVYQSLPNDLKQLFTPLSYPYFAQNNCLFYPKDKEIYIVSLDVEKPYYRRIKESQTWQKMGAETLNGILSECLAGVANNQTIIDKFTTLLSEKVYAPSYQIPEINTLPSVHQLLGLTYMNDLAQGNQLLSDIEATLCNNRCVCAKKGSVFYKITLEMPYTFNALQNGTVRLMTLDEVRTIYHELQQKYGIVFLQARGVRPFIEQYKKAGIFSAERFNVDEKQELKTVFDFNTHHLLDSAIAQATAQFENLKSAPETNDNKTFIVEDDIVSVEDFWRDANDQSNPWYMNKIDTLKNQLGLEESAANSFVTYDNFVFWDNNYISLDLEHPVFMRKAPKSRKRDLLSPEKIKEIISELFKDDIQKRNLILQKIAAVYYKNQLSRDYKRGLPTIAQVVEMYQYQNMIDGNENTDIPATICLNNTIIAKHGEVYYKIIWEPNPLFMRLSNGHVQQMTADEIIQIQRELKEQYNDVVVTSLGLSQRNLLKKNQETRFLPFVYNKAENVSVASQIWEAFSKSSVEPASMEQTEVIFGQLMEQSEEHSVPAMYDGPFIEDGSQLPDYKLLYKTEFLKYQMAHGQNVSEKDFIIPVVLCSDNCVRYKDGAHVHTFSLNENNPIFSIKAIPTGSIAMPTFPKVQEIIGKIETTPENKEQITRFSEVLYKKWQISDKKRTIESKPFPRFDQMVAYMSLLAQSKGEPEPTDIHPIICGNNILYARYDNIYYKIRLNAPMTFEALEGNIVRMMRPDEFERVVKGIYKMRQTHKMSLRQLKAVYQELRQTQAHLQWTISDTGIQTTYTIPSGEQIANAILEQVQKNNVQLEEEKQKPILPNLMPRLKKLLTPISAYPALSAFYDFDENAIDFNALYQIEVIKRALQNNNPDLSAPENNDFEIAPVYANDGRVHYKKGKNHTLISIAPENAFFSVRIIQTPMQSTILLSSVQEVLTLATQSDLQLQQEVLEQLPIIYAHYFATKKGRNRSTKTLPRFDQVIENQVLMARLNGEPEPQNIAPTVCSGKLLCARYDGVYYKISLDENPIFEALENGVVREMRADEFNRILNEINKNNIYQYLKRNNIKSLKNAFYRKQEYKVSPIKAEGKTLLDSVIEHEETLSKDKISLNSFIGQTATQSDLPTFNQLLTGKKETVDIAAAHCADNCIYARKNGIYYKINLAAPITFEALEAGEKRLMNQSELDSIMSDLTNTYDEYYVRQLNMLDLQAAFEAQTAIQNSQELAADKSVQTDIILLDEDEKSNEAEGISNKTDSMTLSSDVLTPTETVEVAEKYVPEVVVSVDMELQPEAEKSVDITKQIKLSPKLQTLIEAASLLEKTETQETEAILQEIMLQELQSESAVAVEEDGVDVVDEEVAPTERKIDTVTPTEVADPVVAVEEDKPDKVDEKVASTEMEEPGLTPRRGRKKKQAPAPMQASTTSSNKQVQKRKRILPVCQESDPETNEDVLETSKSPITVVSQMPKSYSQALYGDTPKESIASELERLLFPKRKITALTPPVYPAPVLPGTPEDMPVLAGKSDFFPDVETLPDFKTLFGTLVFDARIKLGKRKFSNHEDILSFDIAPTLCNDHILFAKEKNLLYQISLDTTNPRFVVRDLITQKEHIMPRSKVRKIIGAWLNDEGKTAEIMVQLAPLYKQYVASGEITPFRNTPPSIQEVFNFYATRASYFNAVKALPMEADKGLFHIPPTCCAGNMICVRTGNLYYKIQLGEPMMFERYNGKDTYLMTSTELNAIISSALKTKAFPKQSEMRIVSLLRQSYKETMQPIFDAAKMEQISRSQYHHFLVNGYPFNRTSVSKIRE